MFLPSAARAAPPPLLLWRKHSQLTLARGIMGDVVTESSQKSKKTQLNKASRPELIGRNYIDCVLIACNHKFLIKKVGLDENCFIFMLSLILIHMNM